MSVIDETLNANKTIANGHDPGQVKPPAPRVAIVTCMDPRLTNILEVLGLGAGDADLIRNARRQHQRADAEGESASVDFAGHSGPRVHL